MATLRERVIEFSRCLETGDTVQAIETFYAEDVNVFENRSLSRAGRKQCIALELDALSKLAAPPQFKIHRQAINEAEGTVFLEYTIRFVTTSGQPQRLDEVAVQTWEGGLITSERFYYEGVVDEGDGDDPH